MNSRYIKLIAIITMTIDHVGYMLYPSDDQFRIIGRIAFPLFAFLIAYGSVKTRNYLKYFSRLLIFALSSQIGYNLIILENLWAVEELNIFFTLTLGVLACWVLKKIIHNAIVTRINQMIRFIFLIFWLAIIVGIFLTAFYIPIDYGIGGVAAIVLFYLTLRHSTLMMKLASLPIVALFCFICIAQTSWDLQWWALLAVPIILLFIDRRLKISKYEKWAFYFYYPLHFCVIWLFG